MSPNVPGAPRGKAQNKRPACALSAIFWRVGPSTRGATAPQRAQQVNFVGRSTAFGASALGVSRFICDGGRHFHQRHHRRH